MSDPSNLISVSILDQDYQFTCPDDEREALKAAALYLDEKLRETKSAGTLVALERIVAEFTTSPQVRPALWYLAEMYKRAGKPQQANSYLERYRSLSPDGALADDALCKLIQNSAQAGKVEAVLRQAQQYRTQYPDGPCIEEIDELLAEIAAKQGEPTEADPAPSEDESSPPKDGESPADAPGDRAPGAQPERSATPYEPQPDGAGADD